MKRRDLLKVTAATAIGAVALNSNTILAQDNSETDYSSAFQNIIVSREGRALILRINKLPRNEASQTTLNEINLNLDRAASDKGIAAVVITGSEKVFSAGAGSDAFQEQTAGMPTHASLAHQVFNRIEAFPKPVIAAINGYCANGGNELALACDIRIAGESATFRQQELQVGLIPGFGGMQRLQRYVGLGRAMDIMLTGRLINADEARAFGLVTSVVADSQVLKTALLMAEQLAEDVNSTALRVFKERMAASYNEPFYAALKNDQQAFDRLVVTEETQKAIQRFIAKQKG